MASVSLIVPVTPWAASLSGRIDALRRGLTAAGHDLEVLVVADPRNPDILGSAGQGVRTAVAELPGKAASAYRGLREASGEFLVIVDLEKGYHPDELSQVLDPLLRGEAEVVVGSTLHGTHVSPGDDSVPDRPLRWVAHRLARPLIGIKDPSSGLVAVTRASYQARRQHPPPLGSRFVLELLVGAVGRRREVPIVHRFPQPRLVFRPNDLRLIKRLADDRFGNYSRLLQFCVVGASGMVVDLTCYALFQLVLSHTFLARLKTPLIAPSQSLDLAAAGALAIAFALVWNFSLNRRLTFNDARKGSILRQFVTYALGNALGIALSLAVRLILPSRFAFFQRHKLAAAVVGIVAATGISFSMSRWVVFNRREPAVAGLGRRRPECCEESAVAERV
jgi:dolichol-phosphate mannosyltransferase